MACGAVAVQVDASCGLEYSFHFQQADAQPLEHEKEITVYQSEYVCIVS